jgi:hypothetical protein
MVSTGSHNGGKIILKKLEKSLKIFPILVYIYITNNLTIMKTLETCKVVVLGNMTAFEKSLKALGIDEIQNKPENIDPDNVNLVFIKEWSSGKFTANFIDTLENFNAIKCTKTTDSVINEIKPHIDINNLKDFKFELDKVYYVTDINRDESVDEYWLFRPKSTSQSLITAHTGCVSVEEGSVVFTDFYDGRVMSNEVISEFREATPDEVKLYEDAWREYQFNKG